MSLITSIKEALKHILPPPVHAFNREIDRVLLAVAAQEKENAALRQQVAALQETVQRQVIENLAARQEAIQSQMSEERATLQTNLKQQALVLAELQKQLEALERLEKLDMLHEELGSAQKLLTDGQANIVTGLVQACVERRKLSEAIAKVQKQAVESTRYASEAVWAETFNNAVSGSTWLKNMAFSPGRWAVGYPVLYVMYRVLNEARPKRILELGLGQSTRMIGQYAAAHEDVEHIVVEHDPEWIEFFKNDFALSERTEILQFDREMAPYKEAEAVRVFKGFREALAGKQFDFIFIDAPLGSDMKQYSRIDVLGLLPECLSEHFVIMIDDYGRSGEINTVKEIESCLDEAEILHKKNVYRGEKSTCILCAKTQAFLASL